MKTFNSNELEQLATIMLNDEKVFDIDGVADYVADTPLIKHEIETPQTERDVSGVTSYSDKTFSMYATVESVLIYTYTPINLLKQQTQSFVVPSSKYNNTLTWSKGVKYSLRDDLQSKMNCLQTLKDYMDGKIIARDVVSNNDISSDNPMFIRPLHRNMERDTYNAYMDLSLKQIPKSNVYNPAPDNSIVTNNQQGSNFVLSDCFDMKPQWNLYLYKDEVRAVEYSIEQYESKRADRLSSYTDNRNNKRRLLKLQKLASKGKLPPHLMDELKALS